MDSWASDNLVVAEHDQRHLDSSRVNITQFGSWSERIAMCA